jgi:hypothetical protein
LDAPRLLGERGTGGARKIYGGNKNFFLASNIGVVAKFPLRGVPQGTARKVMPRGAEWRVARKTPMAFIRKRGNSFYLVHNVRKKGKVQQIHLARLGRRPRISEDIIQGVSASHPFVSVDWDELKAKSSHTLVRPFEENAEELRELLMSVRNLHMDIADLQLPVLGMTQDHELTSRLIAGLKLLRGTLDVKLAQVRKGSPPFDKAGKGLR